MNQKPSPQRDFWNKEANSFQKIYTHEKSGILNLLDRVYRKDMFERFLYTVANCEPINGRTFLDVGCGSGHYCVEVAKMGASKVVGIDISENMLELCRQSAHREGVEDRCTFLHTDLLTYNSEELFDVTIGIGLFDYVSDPLPVLKRFRKVTRDRVIVSFPRVWTWRAPVRKLRLYFKGCDVNFYTKTGVAGLMKEAGFESHIRKEVGKLYCVTGFVGKT